MCPVTELTPPTPLQAIRLATCGANSLTPVAKLLGRHKSTLLRVERGEIDPIPYVGRLSVIYGVPVSRVQRAAREVRRGREGAAAGEVLRLRKP